MRLLDALTHGTTQILDISLIVFAAFATRDPRHAHELAQQEGLEDILLSLLSWTVDVDPFGFEIGLERAEDGRRLGMGKSERNLVCQSSIIL